jgi:uncharacterized protein (TIGR04255 family)
MFMKASLPPPLGGPAPEEQRLANSPLVRVVAQARFSGVLKIDSKEGVAPFQELVRAQYPLLEQMTSHAIQFEVAGIAPNFRPVASNVWRFSDASRTFIISLASDAISLETRNYPGRKEFMGRCRQMLHWVEEAFEPSLALRVGIRYLNRIDGDAIRHLADWIRPNLIGVALPDYREHVTQAISEANIRVDEGEMLLRWGILPKNTTIDPGLLEPLETASWLLDIDAFSRDQRPFGADELAVAFQGLSERVYAVFCWVMTKKGLTHFRASR